MIHIRTQFNQAKTQILTPQLASTLLTNCRQELEETAQESVNRDYHQGKEALGKILTEEQKAALEEAEGLYGQCLEQILWFSYPRGLCLCFRQFYRREAGRALPPRGGGGGLWHASAQPHGSAQHTGRQRNGPGSC